MSTTDPYRRDGTLGPDEPVPAYSVPEGQVEFVDEPAPTPTPSYPVAGTDTSSDSTKDVAKSEAASVAEDAKASVSQVAGTAKAEASNVVSQAQDQAKSLLSQVKGEVGSQAGTQQTRLAEALRALGDELNTMVTGGESSSGPATQLAEQTSARLGSVAGWLEQREPGDVLQEVSRYARRRPGAFLAIAAGIGLLAGRVTRSLADDARSDDQEPAGQAGQAGGTGYPASADTRFMAPGDIVGAAPRYGTAPAPGTTTGGFTTGSVQ